MSAESKKSLTAAPPTALPTLFIFINGGLSGILATFFVHPMDLVKNRLQMLQDSKGSLITTVQKIVKEEGIMKMYRGLSASLMRQATYGTGRLGIYNQLQEFYKQKYGDEKPRFYTLVLMAATAGSCGAFIGCPADVALVRMSTDGRLPPDQRRNYKHVFDAFSRIIREEGVLTLWQGAVPTIGRAVVVNVSALATYTQSKNFIMKKLNLNDGLLLYFCAAMLSGVVTTFNSMPFDVAKTRIQNMQKTKDKAPGIIQVMITIAKTEGVTALWKGIVPAYCRIGPFTTLVFIFNDQITNLYKRSSYYKS